VAEFSQAAATNLRYRHPTKSLTVKKLRIAVIIFKAVFSICTSMGLKSHAEGGGYVAYRFALFAPRSVGGRGRESIP
jgi:hypothetical protein